MPKVECPICGGFYKKSGLKAHINAAHMAAPGPFPADEVVEVQPTSLEGLPETFQYEEAQPATITDNDSEEPTYIESIPGKPEEPIFIGPLPNDTVRLSPNHNDTVVIQSEQDRIIEIASTIAERVAEKVSERTAEQTTTKVAEAFLQQLPSLVSSQINNLLEPLIARLPGAVPQTQSLPTIDQAGQPVQPGSSSRLAELIQLLPVLMQMQGSNNNGITQLAESLKGVAGLFGIMDQIRGVSPGSGVGPGGMTPNSALRWAQWGHDIGKTGGDRPNFPEQTVRVPPTGNLPDGQNPPPG